MNFGKAQIGAVQTEIPHLIMKEAAKQADETTLTDVVLAVKKLQKASL